jgi:hypothetical protein
MAATQAFDYGESVVSTLNHCSESQYLAIIGRRIMLTPIC